ncbi:MAG TPA: GNAT family N-acetyltransferase [Aromatoleum sp.]|uniref:GNAT family N-acetyltransferase n=1 Tax=Aromatoleum sp. TaxID=2307007 RepID=UPI002B48610D|nr:GNAT family N-acetyltransferase [Aromatoleum sp.]HJV28635.1 GNAT family N-acetyltransferase [Aromatoleum sp.]
MARPSAGLSFREIDASRAGLAALTRFYHDNYVREFPDPDERESLANMRRYLRLKDEGWYGRNNYHIVIAEVAGAAVGGVVFDYLAAPNAGVVEFVFVDAAQRRAGIGGALLDEALRILRADARQRCGKRLAAVVAEMNDPFVRPSTPDNLDPFLRAELWGRWGFGVLRFPYVQPALSPGQAPVGCLILIARLFRPVPKTGVPAAWVELVVAEYLRWAMRIDEPERDASFRDMSAFLARYRRIAWQLLQHYVGRDPARDFVVEEIEERGPAFDETLALLRDVFPFPARIVPPEHFDKALADARAGATRYHLWALRAAGGGRIGGMASFFTLPSVGFGGYIALGESMQGCGRLHLVMARIEEQMMRDGPRAQGWYIECGDDSAVVFLRAGFGEVPLEYRPPARADGAAQETGERLHLLYKRFGMRTESDHITRSELLAALNEILMHVYGISWPRVHPCYRIAMNSLPRTASGTVRLRAASDMERLST